MDVSCLSTTILKAYQLEFDANHILRLRKNTFLIFKIVADDRYFKLLVGPKVRAAVFNFRQLL